MKSRLRLTILIAAVALCALVGLSLRYRALVGRDDTSSGTPVDPVNEAKARALAEIGRREQWPESPEAVCRAYWEARAARNYAEMEVLWPGMTAARWAQVCASEPNVSYVFGTANADGKTVPYAPKDYFDTHGTYNLTMRLDVLRTDKGRRHYIWSGN